MSVKYSFYMLIFVLFACGQKTNDFYQGVVLDENNLPLENVRVFEEFDIENIASTNKRGHFKLNRSNDILARLVFVKEGYKTDTIPVVWSQHGERLNYQFLQNDSTLVRLKKKK